MLRTVPTPGEHSTVPKVRKVGLSKPLYFPIQDTRARTNHISCFPCHTDTRISYVYSLLPAPFLPSLPRAPRLQAASSREIIHMQAGRCGARDCSYTGGLVRKSYGHRDLEGSVRQRRQLSVNRPHQRVLPLGLGRHVLTSRGSLQLQTRTS